MRAVHAHFWWADERLVQCCLASGFCPLSLRFERSPSFVMVGIVQLGAILCRLAQNCFFFSHSHEHATPNVIYLQLLCGCFCHLACLPVGLWMIQVPPSFLPPTHPPPAKLAVFQIKCIPIFFLVISTVTQTFLHVLLMHPKHMYNVSTMYRVSQCTFHCVVSQHEAKVSCQHVALCSEGQSSFWGYQLTSSLD